MPQPVVTAPAFASMGPMIMATKTPRALALLLLLAIAAPARADPEPAVFEARMQAAAKQVDGGEPEAALATLDAMLAETETPRSRGRIEGLRFFALARLDRVGQARAAIEFAVATDPNPNAAWLGALFKIRALMGDSKAAAETLVLTAASTPETLDELPLPLVEQVREGLAGDPARRFDLDMALAAAGWLEATPDAARLDSLRQSLIPALIGRGRNDEAKTMLASVAAPDALMKLGIDRSSTALWPAVEARLGPASDTASKAAVARAQAAFKAAPDDIRARLGLAMALNSAAREAEAESIADFATAPEELAELDETGARLVTLHAHLLGFLGRTEDALARLDALGALPVENRPWLGGVLINKALFALQVEEPQRALEIADEMAAMSASLAPVGQLYLAQIRACALARLGRRAEATEAAGPILAATGANPDVTLATLLCLGRQDAAAAAVIALLDDPAERVEMLWELQPFLLGARPKTPGEQNRSEMRAIKARADVRSAFEKAGRDLPAKVSPPR